MLEHSYFDGLEEKPMYVVLNGAEGALTEKPLVVDQASCALLCMHLAGHFLQAAALQRTSCKAAALHRTSASSSISSHFLQAPALHHTCCKQQHCIAVLQAAALHLPACRQQHCIMRLRAH
jgi:hypothetical protein